MIEYKSDSSLYDEFLTGINKLMDNVGSTLGPKGKNVLIKQKDKLPLITKDGVTVSKFVNSENLFEQAAIDIIREASERTNSDAGDGTTTSTLIAGQIFKEGYKYLISNYNPHEIKKGIETTLKLLEEKIKNISLSINSLEELEDIAMVSSNGDKAIASVVVKALESVGREGAISVEESNTEETSLEIVEGFVFDSGIVSNSFITDERKGIMKHDNPLILVTDHKIESSEEIWNVMEMVSRANLPLVIVASGIEGEANALLNLNAAKGTIKAGAIKISSYGSERKSVLEDLCIATGATFISKESGMFLKDVEIEQLGQAKSVESSKYQTAVVGCKGDLEQIETKINSLREEIKQERDFSVCKVLQDRITRLSSAIAIIKVGGLTESAMTEKKHRVEDALEAVISAQEMGYVPGGGVVLTKLSKELEEEVLETEEQELGKKILLKAIQYPLRKLCQNSHQSFDMIRNFLVSEEGYEKGFNFSKLEKCVMIDDGIIEPTKVLLSALKNGVAAGGLLLTTGNSICFC